MWLLGVKYTVKKFGDGDNKEEFGNMKVVNILFGTWITLDK